MKSEIHIKPCPFCGGKAEVKKCHHKKNYYVVCGDCGAETSRDYLFNISAANAWNTRLDIDGESTRDVLERLKWDILKNFEGCYLDGSVDDKEQARHDAHKKDVEIIDEYLKGGLNENT